MYALEVRNLKKTYQNFTLGDLSFSVETGQIAGLIGRNGAGKSTTLKSIMRLISSEGTVQVFGKDFAREENTVKGLIGYVGGGFRFYPNKSLAAVARTVSRFYPHWNGEVFKRCCDAYALVLTKRIRELSEGMRIKFSLALALSHGAKLLLLDEPTSGLDPLSREEFCDTILSLREQGVTVLFSTHITSDLLRVADKIVYLSDGILLADEPLDALLKRYRLGRFPSMREAEAARAIGVKAVKEGFEGLIEDPLEGREATLDEIMIHLEWERGKVHEIAYK